MANRPIITNDGLRCADCHSLVTIDTETMYCTECGTEVIEPKETNICYENWKGKISIRRIIPIQFIFGSTEHHPELQWLMEAFDLDKKAKRTFALAGITRWWQ